MNLSRPWLQKIAGWKAVKKATTIFNAGAVVDATQNENVVKGVIVSGKRRQAAGLRIDGPTDVENLCTCYVSRQSGQICEHSVAVVLALIEEPPRET